MDINIFFEVKEAMVELIKKIPWWVWSLAILFPAVGYGLSKVLQALFPYGI